MDLDRLRLVVRRGPPPFFLRRALKEAFAVIQVRVYWDLNQRGSSRGWKGEANLRNSSVNRNLKLGDWRLWSEGVVVLGGTG